MVVGKVGFKGHTGMSHFAHRRFEIRMQFQANRYIHGGTQSAGLELFQRKHGICVVSGLAAALRGGLISELIVDEPTARNLVEEKITF